MTVQEEILLSAIRERQREKERVLVAIDGQCASGKTSLAKQVGCELSCPVLSMDDFFLRPFQRTKERLAEPGGNVDRERFWEEVLCPAREGLPFSYRPYDCRTGTLGEAIAVPSASIYLIEGAYSCHPDLWDHYDLHVYMSTTPDEQWKRLLARNGEEAERFQTQWIPLEERYFDAFDISKRCDICLTT